MNSCHLCTAKGRELARWPMGGEELAIIASDVIPEPIIAELRKHLAAVVSEARREFFHNTPQITNFSLKVVDLVPRYHPLNDAWAR